MLLLDLGNHRAGDLDYLDWLIFIVVVGVNFPSITLVAWQSEGAHSTLR